MRAPSYPRWLGSLAFAALIAAGCSKRRAPEPSARARSSAAAQVSASASASARASAAPAPEAQPAPPLEEAGVKKLVEAWLAAQNEGNFAAYERLYAPRFTGIKRSGQYKASFAREGWLKDRAGMFMRPMRVSLREPRFTVTPSGGVVRAEQTWSSGSYEDVGLKQLVIVPTSEGPRIAREEMLSSKIAGSEAQLATGDLVLVDRHGLILSTDPEDAWATGPSTPESRQFVASRAVREENLPPQLAAWKGRAVRTLDAAGTACEATVKAFKLRAEVTPHFGTVQAWKGEQGEEALTPAQTAAAVWDLAGQGGRVLVGELEPTCAGLWALDARKTPPAAAAPIAAQGELRAKALRTFRALPRYTELQGEFLRSVPGARGLWEDYEDNDVGVSAFRFGGRAALVVVTARAGRGCGDFYGELSAIFGVRPNTSAALELLDTPDALVPASAFDLDGDGTPEILFGPERTNRQDRLLWQKTAKGASLTPLFAVPFFDCPC